MIPQNAKKVFSWIIFDIYRWEQELFDWTTTTFEKAKRRWTALIIPVLENWNILITKEIQPWKEEFIDFVWGSQEKWDSLLKTAKKELLEETWYIASDLELIFSENLWGSKLDWELEYYIAKWLKKVWEQKLDWWEKIELLEISLDDLLNLNLWKYNCKIDEYFAKTVKQIAKDEKIINKLKI